MSIWGKRVDAWVDRKAGAPGKADVERATLRFLWQAGLVLLVVLVVVVIFGSPMGG